MAARLKENEEFRAALAEQEIKLKLKQEGFEQSAMDNSFT